MTNYVSTSSLVQASWRQTSTSTAGMGSTTLYGIGLTIEREVVAALGIKAEKAAT